MNKLVKASSILLAIMMIVTLAACGEGKQAGNTQTSAVTAQGSKVAETSKERLKIKFFSFSTEDTRKGINQYIQDTAAAAFPDYDFEYEIAGQDYADKLKVYNSSGEVPDVFFTSVYDQLDPIVRAGNVLDLLPYVKAEKFDEKYTVKTPIEPGADGKLYAINTGADNLFTPRIFYRKDIFEKYGIVVPKTWDEFLAACKTLKDNKIIPLTSYGAGGWLINTCLLQQMIMNENPQVVNDLIDGKTDLNNPVCISALNRAGLLFKEGYFAPGLLNMDFGASAQLFKDGKAAMYIMFSFAIPEDTPTADIMLWPSVNPNVDTSKDIQIWGGPMNGYAGSSKNPNPEAIAKLVMWCTVQEATYFNKEKKSPTALQTGIAIEGLSPLAQTNKELFEAAPNKFRTITNYGFKSKLTTEMANASQKLMTGKYTGEEYAKDIMPIWTENFAN